MRDITPISSPRLHKPRPGPWRRTTQAALWYLPLIHVGCPALVPWPRPETRLKLPPAARGAGIALAAIGCWLTTAAVYTLVRYGDGTPAPHDPPKVFVTHGPYRYCRNPMELGNFLMLLGRSVCCGSLRTGVASLVFAVGTHAWVVLVEEPFLLRHFGSAYRAYQARVPRWGWTLPWLQRGEALHQRRRTSESTWEKSQSPRLDEPTCL